MVIGTGAGALLEEGTNQCSFGPMLFQLCRWIVLTSVSFRRRVFQGFG